MYTKTVAEGYRKMDSKKLTNCNCISGTTKRQTCDKTVKLQMHEIKSWPLGFLEKEEGKSNPCNKIRDQ